jgi:hypothetical protein
MEVCTYFSNQGAARYGLTPIWFNHTMPSGAVSRPSRDSQKSYGPRVPNRTMVAKFGHVLLLLVSEPTGFVANRQ